MRLIRKRFKAANYKLSDYQDEITFELAIKNIGSKDVRAFDGTLIFVDLLDNKIMSSSLAINESIAAGTTLNWRGGRSSTTNSLITINACEMNPKKI